MHLNRLVMRNFKKFRRADLEFSDGLTGIVGSNGAGKSTIVEAIAWALYGNRASAIKRDFIRNCRARESDAVNVALTISLGKQELVIYRGMKGKANTPEAYLELDGQRIALGSREVDSKLEEILKIGYQDFMKTFYARQKDLDSLLKEGAMGKREYLLKLLGLEDIKEHALDLIKADRAAAQEEMARLSGALGEIGDVSCKLEQAALDIQAEEKGLEEADRKRTGLARSLEERQKDLDLQGERMRSHEMLQERKASLEKGQAELDERAEAEERRLAAIDLSRRRLQEIQPRLERLAEVRLRLDTLEPKRAAFEDLARSIASRRAALEGERKALAEGQSSLKHLEEDAAEREALLSKEEEYILLQDRLAALEKSRDRHRDLQSDIRQAQSQEQSLEQRLNRAVRLHGDLLRDKARLAEIRSCREEEIRCRDELADLLREREKQNEIDDLQVKKSGLEQRLALRKSEAEGARAEMEALKDIEAREKLLLRQDRDLDQLNSELSRILAETRGSRKAAEKALAEAERSLQRVKALGEEGLCPTCERPLQGQRDLLVGKYERSLIQARVEIKRLDEDIATQKEKLEGVARSRSNLRSAFDQINAEKSRHAALQASIAGLARQMDELQAERNAIAARIKELGQAKFDRARLEEVEARLQALNLLVQEHAALSLRLQELPGQEKEIADAEKELAELKGKISLLQGQAEALGFHEADFLEARGQALSLKPVHDRFLALSGRAAQIPPLRQRCEKLKQDVSELEKALQAFYESQEALGYDPALYDSLFKEKRELASAESERQRIALLMAGEGEARERLKGILAATERLKAEMESCQQQISSLSYRLEEHEKARAALAEARAELESAGKILSERQVQMRVLLAERDRLVREAERKVELEKSAALASRKGEVVDATRLLINSFMDQVLIRVKNEIARTAGEILEEVSGKYSLIKIDEDFNIQVEDGGTFYPISRYSGGEIDMIAVSVRVAISEYLMRFGPDGSSYSFLILDEVFGSQDQEHREKMIQMLRSLEERFPQIIAISHISDVQGQFDNTFLVAEDEVGNSRVEALS